MISEAPVANLLHYESGIFVDALWERHMGLVYMFTQPYMINYFVYGFHVVYLRYNYNMVMVVQTVAGILLLNELKEIKNSYSTYFNSIWNWLDLLGNLSIVSHCSLIEYFGFELYNH